MTGGLDHTDCSEVIAAVYRYLDGEMDPALHHRIHDHLDECGPCLRQYGIEQEVRALVARCCRAERAPDTLRSRIVLTLQQAHLQEAHLPFGVVDPLDG